MAKKPAITKRTAGKTKTAAKAKARAPGPPARGSSPKLKATPAGTRDKDHLISVIQAGTGASKKAAGETLDALLETITLSLKKNTKVRLVGFGSFEVVKRKARKGRNPATGEAIRVMASKGVRFKAGTKLKGGV